MIYFLYFLFFLVFLSSVFLFFLPKKARRAFYLMAYLLPFWVWGTIVLLISFFLWNSKEVASNPSIISLISIIFFIKGGIIIISTKRGIKKKIELWRSLPLDKIKLVGVGVYFLSLLFFIGIFGIF